MSDVWCILVFYSCIEQGILHLKTVWCFWLNKFHGETSQVVVSGFQCLHFPKECYKKLMRAFIALIFCDLVYFSLKYILRDNLTLVKTDLKYCRNNADNIEIFKMSINSSNTLKFVIIIQFYWIINRISIYIISEYNEHHFL